MSTTLQTPYLLLALASFAALLSFDVKLTALGQTSFKFYSSSCPQAELVIAASVRAAAAADASVPPKLLRILFHDCFVEGCDGSILLDSTPTNAAEKSDPANANLAGLGVINGIKSALELVCSGVVSCADVVALAARDAVVVMGGPRVDIPTGRKDSFTSLAANVRPNLPDTPFSLDELLNFFGRKGLSLQDLVVLSGAHTVGVAHCTAFNDRFIFTSNGTAVPNDPTMDPAYAAQLAKRCPENPNPSTLIVNDIQTPTIFDKDYYSNVEAGRALFHSDEMLLQDPRTLSLVQKFAQDQASFFTNWEESFRKLSLVEVKTGSQGEVRKQCTKTNA